MEILYLFKKLVSIITAKRLQKEFSQIIKDLITEHHSLYMLISKKSLSFKTHMVTHYPKIFEMCGPLELLSSMRFEGKHKVFTTIAKSINSGKNITYSLAKRHELSLSFHLLNDIMYKKTVTLGKTSKINYANLYHFLNLDNDFSLSNCVKCNWIEISGTRYNKNIAIAIDNDSLEIEFGVINDVIIKNIDTDTPSYHFIYEELEINNFDEHFDAYSVSKSNNLKLVEVSKLFSYPKEYNIFVTAYNRQYCKLFCPVDKTKILLFFV